MVRFVNGVTTANGPPPYFLPPLSLDGSGPSKRNFARSSAQYKATKAIIKAHATCRSENPSSSGVGTVSFFSFVNFPPGTLNPAPNDRSSWALSNLSSNSGVSGVNAHAGNATAAVDAPAIATDQGASGIRAGLKTGFWLLMNARGMLTAAASNNSMAKAMQRFGRVIVGTSR